MTIDRISRIKGHRIFRDFSWPNSLPNFAQFNLIYGWNGAGKTTLSNIFRAIEKRETVDEGHIEVVVDGNPHQGDAFNGNQSLPKIRVFNREYVEASVFKSGGASTMDPIFVLGEDSVEKQKEIERLQRDLEKIRLDLSTAQAAKVGADRKLEAFRSEKALAIKNLLGSEPTSKYRNYNKSDFGAKAEALEADSRNSEKLLKEEERGTLILRQQERPKDKVPTVALALKNLAELKAKTERLLSVTVVAQTIDRLIKHPSIATWVESGTHLHKAGTEKCEFCGSEIPEGRLKELEGHFNDQLKKHLAELDEILSEIVAEEDNLNRIKIPVIAQLYSDLSAEYSQLGNKLSVAVSQRIKALKAIKTLVEEKRGKPFEKVAPSSLASITDENSPAAVVEGINAIIQRHNRETDDFAAGIETARKRLEEDFLVGLLSEHRDLKQNSSSAAADISRYNAEITAKNDTVSELTREVAQHVRPAEELNTELAMYLGRRELELKVEGGGYILARNGVRANNLSEGEKTAIAFLHFLKNLQANTGENAFDLKKGIVVVDDPVSSLDANALFCAFAFLKERTKDAGQLFVLTHNFTFFNQVKIWLSYMRKDEKNHYMLQTSVGANGREAVIGPLDPSLERFNSEYQFLFSKIHAEATSTSQTDLGNLYALPNITRRFLEAFLLFRRPSLSIDPKKPDLHQKINAVAPGFDEVKKTRILRFLQTFSHDNKVGEAEHDLFLLSETRDVLKDVLSLIESEDSTHYKGMVEAISKSSSASR